MKALARMTAECQLVALATRSHAARASFYPTPIQVAADYRDLLRSDLDAVIVAVPPRYHLEILEAALAAEKAVMIEKPLCLDAISAESAARAVARSGLPVLVNHVHLFGAPYRALKKQLESRGESPLVVVSEGGALGPFREDWNALWDWLPHDLALVLDLFGDFPSDVSAVLGPDPDRPENCAVRLSWARGGRAWIHAGRLLPAKRRLLSVVTERSLYVSDERAQDPLTVRDFSYVGRYGDGANDTSRDRPLPFDNSELPLEHALRTFIEAIRGGNPRGMGVELACAVVKLIAEIETAGLG